MRRNVITGKLLLDKGFSKEIVYCKTRNFFRKIISKHECALLFKKGSIEVCITLEESGNVPFYYSIGKNKLGELPDDELFLDLLIKHYGK